MEKDDMKKILLLTPLPNGAGGISRWSQHITNYYRNMENKEVILDSLFLSEPFIPGTRFYERIRRAYEGISRYIRYALAFRNTIKRDHYDIAHIVSSASLSLLKDLLLIKIAHQHNVKTIVHFRFGRIPALFRTQNWEWKLLAIVVSHSEHIIVIDESSYNILTDAGYRNISYIPNPIAKSVLDIIEQNKEIEHESGKVIFVGQMYQSKGIYEFVEACKCIKNIKAEMYGITPNGVRKTLLELAGENNEWLDVVGEIPYEGVIKKMMSASVFVLPTYSEGFPNVILESMACGCPIVASAVGAIPEMLNIKGDVPCGICVSPRNTDELRDKIEFMLANRNSAQKYGVLARQRVIKEYSIDSVYANLVNLWKKI